MCSNYFECILLSLYCYLDCYYSLLVSLERQMTIFYIRVLNAERIMNRHNYSSIKLTMNVMTFWITRRWKDNLRKEMKTKFLWRIFIKIPFVERTPKEIKYKIIYLFLVENEFIKQKHWVLFANQILNIFFHVYFR